MFRILIAAFSAALCFGAPAFAQSFSHSHGPSHGHGGGYHSHDTTSYTSSGSCCQSYGCDRSQAGHRGHGPHAHGPHAYRQYAPVTTRTYTRIYAPNVTTRRVYTQPQTRRVYVEQRASEPHYNVQYHNDRGAAWAHYDRRWKSRTNTRRHRHPH